MYYKSLYLLTLIVFLFSCKKETETPIEYGSLTDVEGNSYVTVKIGDQWWMAEDLRVKKYRNGVSISVALDTADWKNSTEGKYCVYENLPTANGLLYNHHVVASDSNVAPLGWHVATDEDWKVLENHLGMSTDNAGKTGWRGSNQADLLRSSGRQYWAAFDNVWSSNDYGFSANAGGCRLPDGRWSVPTGLSFQGFWWTSTRFNSDEGWYRYMDYKSSKVFRSHDDIRYGFSIRCVKD